MAAGGRDFLFFFRAGVNVELWTGVRRGCWLRGGLRGRA